MTEDAAFYDRALRRMSRLAMVIGAAATLYIAARYGWRDGLGCAAGAAVSILNLHWWKRLTRGMGGDETPKKPASAVFFGMRYLILGGICFVIIKFFGVNYLALIAGLLISVAAVLAESVYELVFTNNA